MQPNLGINTLLLQTECHSVHHILRKHILHGRIQIDQYQFLKSVVLRHGHVSRVRQNYLVRHHLIHGCINW